MRMCYRPADEAQKLAIQCRQIIDGQHAGQHIDHQLVILPLRQAGYHDGADATDTAQPQRKTTAMCRMLGQGQAVFFLQSGLLALAIQTDRQ